ncbi:MAG: hypothetical protein IT376_14570 [Polyangiaceae bacterium]|nr:hypothetical protein [Polyangiaceae bacterium]
MTQSVVERFLSGLPPLVVGSCALCAAAGVAPGCSGERAGPGGTQQAPPPGAQGEYAIHVYEALPRGGSGPRYRERLIGPAGATRGSAAVAGVPQGVAAPPRGAAVTVIADGGAVQIAEPEGYADGTALLVRAAQACGVVGDDFMVDATSNVWRDHNWYFFTGRADGWESCDELLDGQERVLCVADKLSEVSQAVAPVVWGEVLESGALVAPEWIIPPQSTRDRFIARDLALNALANLARLELERPLAATFPERTCTEAWVRSVDGAYLAAHAHSLYQVDAGNPPYYFAVGPLEEEPIDSTTAVKHASARLDIKTRVLVAAGELLKELIEDTVEADLAGGEAKRARAGDPKRGAAEFFGVGDDPYNNVSHAFRWLTGRLEVDFGGPAPPVVPPWGEPQPPYAEVPQCGTPYQQPCVLRVNVPDGTAARLDDTAVRTAEQQYATRLVDAAGIIVPRASLGSDFTVLRAAVTEQLQLQAARSAGVASAAAPEFAAFATGPRGLAIAADVAAVGDGDLRFALDKNLTAFRILTNQGPGASTAEPSPGSPTVGPGGLAYVDLPGRSPLLVAIGGVTLAAGMPRSDVVQRGGAWWRATVTSAQAAQAPNDVALGGEVLGAALAGVGRVTAFQDVYHVGATFQRALAAADVHLQSEVALAETPAAATSRAGSAALATWAGPGMVVWWRDVGTQAVTLVVTGLDPSEIGVVDDGSSAVVAGGHEIRLPMVGQLRLVRGEPWEAECVAGLRTACGPGVSSDRVYSPSTDLPLRSQTVSVPEAYHRLHLLAFDAVPYTVPPAATDVLYLVSRGSPEGPGRGRILAALANRDGGLFATVISVHRDRMVEGALGISDEWVTDGTDVGKDATDTSPNYCIEGVPRDFFVPLENELTGNDDGLESSWRHYLDLALQASARTDELGRQLIEQGLQKDYRSEAAGEELGQVCGQFGAFDDLSFEDGRVQVAEVATHGGNEALSVCMDEPTWDVVLLTNDPFASMTPQEATARIKAELLDCAGGGASNALCAATEITHAGLDLAPYEEVVAPPANCNAFQDVVDSVDTGFNATKLADAALDLDPDRLSAVVAAMRVRVEDNGNWRLTLDGNLLMATDDARYWPGCIDGGGPHPCAAVPPAAEAVTRTLHDLLNAGYSVGTLDAAGRDELFGRLSGVLWTLAALTGYAPAGLFDLPVPAVNFADAYWEGLGEDERLAHANTVYGSGRFVLTPTGRYRLNVTDLEHAEGLMDADANAMREVALVNAVFASAAKQSAWRPVWQREVYETAAGHPSAYLHTRATSEARVISHPSWGVISPVRAKFYQVVSEAVRGHDGLRGAESGGSCTATDRLLQERVLQIKANSGIDASGYESGGAEITCLGPTGRVPILRGLHGAFVDLAVGLSYGDIQSGLYDEFGPPAYVDIEESDLVAWGAASSTDHVVWGTSSATSTFQVPELCLNAIISVDPLGWSDYFIKSGCIRWWQSLPSKGSTWWSQFTTVALRPTSCGADQRALIFMNALPRFATPCAAARELARSVALGCVLSRGYSALAPGEPMPVIQEVEDIGKLEGWVSEQSRNARLAISRIVLQRVPKRVVADFREGRVGSGATDGEHGQLVLQYETGVQGLAEGWKTVEGELSRIGGAIGVAKVGLVGAQLATKLALKRSAMARIQLESERVRAMVGALAGWGSGIMQRNPYAAVGAVADGILAADAATRQLELQDDIEAIEAEQGANDVARVLADFHASVGPSYTNLQSAIDRLRGSSAAVLSTGSALRSKQQQAQYAAAKGALQDYVALDGANGPETVPLRVNTVLRRQYDLTRRRYERSLRDAKYLAYMARLAVEQRIGMRLNEIQTPIGPLPPPREWADEICTFQGVNYERFRAGDGTDGGITDSEFFGLAPADATRFTDPFLGDYVTRLASFVDYYNIQYPFHDAEDLVALSVRDDLLGPTGACYVPGRNLLRYSHQLDRASADGTSVRGWSRSGRQAGSPTYLSVVSGEVLVDSEPGDGGAPVIVVPPATVAAGGYTWLSDQPVPATGTDGGVGAGDGGAGDAGDAEVGDPSAGGTGPSAPSSTVYQAVELVAGQSYVLSWFDMARGSDGGPPAAGEPPAYRVAVYDGSWGQVRGDTPVPSSAGAGDAGAAVEWSSRRVLGPFTVSQSGIHYVAFGASLGAATGGPAGSVAIANVQLELATGAEGATAYQATTDGLLVLSGDCALGSPADLRAAFDYRCEGGECFHELRAPIVVDTSSLHAGTSRLVGRLAKGNYNYRHVSLAVNVVGTGVLDCSVVGTTSCYGTGYLEYTLAHDAFDIPILDHTGTTARGFDFGSASIRHGKALATERYITTPVGGVDLGLLSQASVQKPELRGRPLDGAYRLRIHDSPALRWDRLDDLQIVLTYRYWSAVSRQDSTQ